MTGVGPLLPDDPVRLGHYELVGRLGEGGQSVVYLGRRDDGVQVAVRLLHDRFSRDPEERARFERELRMIGRVAGSCTAQVLDADISGDLPYVVSEYVPGPSLSGLVDEQGPRTGADLDRLATGTVTALAEIHRAGIPHRDFKPSNVLMGPDGPRVIDFGIAHLGSLSAEDSGGMDTPPYTAPEQVSDAEPGTGADMFAWAATMLFAATGRHPFGDDAASAVLHRVQHDEPDLSALPEPLRGAVASCLAKDPAARPQAREVLLNLLGDATPAVWGDEETLSTGADFAGTAPAERRRTVPPLRSRRALGIAAAVAAPLLALTAAGTAWALRSDGSGEDGPVKAPAAVKPKAEELPAEPPAAAASARKAAERAIEAVLTLGHASLDEDRASARRLSTPRYGDIYAKRFTIGLYDHEELRARKASVRAKVAESAVVAASSGKVTVLAYVERTVRAENMDPDRLRDPLRATVLRQGERWLLDELYPVEAYSLETEAADEAWPGPRARAAMDAVARHPSVASGTLAEKGLRPAGRPDRLLALVVVGECEADCTDDDPVMVRRLELQRAGDGWKVTTSKRLASPTRP